MSSKQDYQTYSIPSSPRSLASRELTASASVSVDGKTTAPTAASAPATSRPSTQPTKPSLRLLFSSLTFCHAPLLTLAIFLSIVSGALPPIMSRILGQLFDAYTAYNPSGLPASALSAEAKATLMHKITMGVWHLSLVGLGVLVLSTAMISTWIVIGETVASRLRRRVYLSVSQRKMEWFDLGAGVENDDEDESSEKATTDETASSSLGAGGLMAKFSRETDDVRLATSQYSGQLLQYLTTCLACLVLALVSCWSLALVILASIPVTIVVTGAVEKYTVPHLATERAITAKASSLVERVALSIATVKAFDAEAREMRRFSKLLDVGSKAYKKVSLAWGIRLGVSSFLTFSMFVQGFWYGSHLVQAGKTTPGTVFTVFSACLIASQHLQLIIQTLQIVEKGKISALGLEKLMHVDEARSSRGGAKRSASIRRKPSGAGHGGAAARVMRLEDIPSSPLKSAHSDSGFSRHGHGRSASLHTLTSPNPNRRRFRDHHGGGGGLVSMRKIRPETRCLGEINLTNVSFTYPSVKKAAAAAPGEEQTMTLQGVNMFIPAGEATFVVGGSGSGKSTIAQLLLRLYRPDSGTIEVDDRDVRFLDPEWFRAQIASVDQHPIVFDLSVHDNVALGLSGRAHELKPGSVTYTKDHVPVVPRSEVEQACRTALLHEFVKGLPDGYDTILGTRGSSLSGGQKQRLAIARARLRDPPILILDEATSALDPTSRLLINEAVKTWRKGRTTIIITHDLSQVEAGDFLYMMKQGQVVENGYREDLERSGASGLFRELAEQQREQAEDERQQRVERDAAATAAASPSSSSWALSTPKLARLASGTPSPNEQVEELVELLPQRSTLSYRSPVRDTTRSADGLGLSSPSRRSTFRYNPAAASSDRDLRRHGRQPSSDSLKTVGSAYSSTSDLVAADKTSTPPVRISNDDPTLSDRAGAKGLRTLRLAEQQHAWVASRDAPWLEDAGKVAASLRSQPSSAPASIRTRKVWSEDDLNKSVAALKDLHIDLPTTKSNAAAANAIESAEAILSPPAPLWPTLRFALATTPRKPLLILGLICSILFGALTPLFSFFLGKLLATMGLQGQSHNVLVYALFVLCLAVLEGIFSFGNFYTMEVVGEAWIQKLRGVALRKVVRQDKTWFDTAPDAKPGTLVARTIQDAEDARNLLARQIGALLIVLIMVLAGITWAMITGWQLTLVGLAVGPIFIAAMTLQSSVVARFEVKNKARRETVAKSFYEVASNIRGVRSMALEGIFASQFDDALQATKRDALRAAPFSGFGFGLGEALTYMCEALLFYVGALFITRGIYDFERMVVVFNLFIFAVSFAAMTMAYLPGLTKALQATADMRRLVELGEEGGSERVRAPQQQQGQPWQGQEEQEQGHIVFKDVSFKYPSRPNVPVLTSASFSVQRGEKVAIVGPSGCGKSTIAALLQRLYEPEANDEAGTTSSSGIYLDGHRIDSLPTTTLRHRLAVISQHPNLFDMSVEENVEYGLPDDETRTDGVATSAAIRAACSLAQSSSFIAALPKGYGTQLGDAASLVSGGQKQRLAIARALLRFLPPQQQQQGRRTNRASVLILDEATSALDDVTRAAVLDVVLPTAKSGHTAKSTLLADTTVLAVTHKLDEMKRCDRIVVLEEGKVVQQGSFEELMQVKGGAFRTLASAGGWGA